MMENRRNYYRILHVQPDAPAEIIRSSYRTLMQRLRMHPDLGGDHWNASLINEAYQVLMNRARRERYDQDRDLVRRSAPVAEAAADGGPRSAPDAEGASRGEPDSYCYFCLAPHEYPGNGDPEAVCARCESPLFIAEKACHEATDQRTVRRIERNLAIEFYASWPQMAAHTGRTQDVSPNGMRFVTDQPVTEGRRLKITSRAFDAVAWVTHSHAIENEARTRWIVGVAFDTLKYNRTKGAFVSTQA